MYADCMRELGICQLSLPCPIGVQLANSPTRQAQGVPEYGQVGSQLDGELNGNSELGGVYTMPTSQLDNSTTQNIPNHVELSVELSVELNGNSEYLTA
jgi:hypothetical protein